MSFARPTNQPCRTSALAPTLNAREVSLDSTEFIFGVEIDCRLFNAYERYRQHRQDGYGQLHLLPDCRLCLPRFGYHVAFLVALLLHCRLVRADFLWILERDVDRFLCGLCVDCLRLGRLETHLLYEIHRADCRLSLCVSRPQSADRQALIQSRVSKVPALELPSVISPLGGSGDPHRKL